MAAFVHGCRESTQPKIRTNIIYTEQYKWHENKNRSTRSTSTNTMQKKASLNENAVRIIDCWQLGLLHRVDFSQNTPNTEIRSTHWPKRMENAARDTQCSVSCELGLLFFFFHSVCLVGGGQENAARQADCSTRGDGDKAKRMENVNGLLCTKCSLAEWEWMTNIHETRSGRCYSCGNGTICVARSRIAWNAYASNIDWLAAASA